MKRITASILGLFIAAGTVGAQEPTITELLSRDVTGVPGRELLMITVAYPPGGSDPVHRHHAQAMVYVLEGSVVMQIKGKAPVTLSAGQTFYEGPDDVHLVARNASTSASARFLVVFVKDKNTPIKVGPE